MGNSTVTPSPTTAPTSSIVPWLVGDTQVSLFGSNNYIDDTIRVTNEIGSKVTDPISVKLFNKNCDIEETNSPAVVSLLGVDNTPATFEYQVNINQSMIGDVNGTYMTCITTDNSACGVGKIEFCTRVSTYHESLEIAFRETNFEFTFNLTDNDFSLENISIEENQPNSFVSNVVDDYGVEACQCDFDFNCISAVTITQNENLVMCLKPTHPTNPNAVEISNFYIDIDPSDSTISVATYSPVIFSATTWDANSLTDVAVDDTGFVVKISTPIVAQFFINNVNQVDVTGNAFLVFKTAKDVTALFADYGIQVGLAIAPQAGCFALLIKQVRDLF